MTKSPDPPHDEFDAEAFKQFEHSGWVEVGAAYGDHFGPLTSQAIEPLLDAAGVRAGARVLDVACGPGFISAAAARRGAKPVGIDFSSSMITAARTQHPGIEFREGDAEALPLPDRAFDAVVSGFGMLHFAQPERAAAEAFRVLDSGGRFAFSVWDAPEQAVVFGIVLRAIETHGRLRVGLPAGPDFFRFSDATQSRNLLESAGFIHAGQQRVPLTWAPASADAILDTFLSAGVRTRGLLRAQQSTELEAIRAAVRREAAAYEHSGRLELPTPCVVCSAVKP
jgi:ubiquinone/menaquinone biosynthesis C-methylase UbiE